ncbi:uncharacterized protein L3040_004877 [Drepanopeziza brunnea f. sp. 'multigermtubi']|uniref:uncharacterized protein n=1 Tax=Drepanopeziza brunnea f. sp. 'multigermtubi' TaxID=698441 RepID=UPI002387F243|nr:hypothetical protein L3040_004877 [Drepanopeziza brunnea f. sp. 'multigermtubi']
MPSHLPSSFASAAAGSSRDSRNGRGDGRGSGDWSRREQRPANGTLTLRRNSQAPFQHPSSQDSPLQTPSTEAPALSQQSNLYDSAPSGSRYSKQDILDIAHAQREAAGAVKNVSSLFINGWDPDNSNGTNGTNGRTGWGKSADGREHYGPEVCWNPNGDSTPISFEQMSEGEKILFATDVNSPLKPPPQNSNKDQNAQGAGTNGRKTSFSHGQTSGNFGLASPASSRPGTRRQLTSDALQSPSGAGRFARDEPSPFLNRKFTDTKDGQDDRADDTKPGLPFGGLMRSSTAGNALGNGPASPWGPGSASAALSPMGNFGNFSLGNSSANPPAPVDKRPAFGRGESRLAHLMNKESTEDMSKTADRPWRPRQRTDTDPFGDDVPSGSAALGGGRDTSPPLNNQQRAPGVDTPVRGNSSDFGMSEMPGFQNAARSQVHQTPARGHDKNEPLSPSDTNPYRSPPGPSEDHYHADDSSYEGDPPHNNRPQGLGGIPEHAPNAFGGLPRAFNNALDGSDRSQTSSAGAIKVFPPLSVLPSGFGGLGGWPTSGNPLGTPDRENRTPFPSNAFGSSVFGPMGELQSPSLGGLGNMFGPSGGASGTNNVGRSGSKLGSLFPAAMQAQMLNPDHTQTGEGGDVRQSSGFGAIGRSTFPRDTESPMRTDRHPFDDLFAASDVTRNQGPFSSAENSQGMTSATFSQVPPATAAYGQSQSSSDSASNQLPATQQRMMVMPDRMRWVYLDPQGKVQGPWSGLEMHDWYKASFFTADLSVKKVEDAEFEPLGQLIRRIGNSREPFLVPQIGIPHGPAPAQGAAFTPAAAGPGNGAQPGAVQPPFANSFPSFGTTLTAEQQNNLERRKQEEQFLMARQKEFLAQQQVNVKQMQMGGLPSALHHHSSAHSLQSQPSFGSMTSPIGLPQSQMQNVAGYYEGPPRQFPAPSGGGIASEFFREEELARLSLRDRQQLFPSAPPQQQSTHAQQISSLFGPNSEAQRQAARMEQEDPSGFNARLEEFQQLRAQHEMEEANSVAHGTSEPIGPPQQQQQQVEPAYHETPEAEREPPAQEPESKSQSKPQPASLSLTEQVQNAKSAQESPTTATQPESPWAKVPSSSFPMPFPPPQSSTPLPAPTAQRSRANLPEALNVESRSRSETPEVTSSTSSLAPWAKEQTEAPKGPSLKQIQEAEAKKAAKAEEIAAAARRANYEYELKLLSSQPAAPAPGLPTSSTWGSTSSPVPNAPSAWAKPAAKVQVSSSSAASKKTLADIQREEESRKVKAAAAVAAAQPTVSSGKRYADLASKPSAGPAPVGGSPWSTVGAGGKVRIPTGPAAVTPPALRAASAANTVTPSAQRAVRPAAVRSTTGTVGANAPKEEFVKWAKSVLANGLNPDINVDEFVVMLRDFPPEASIIADSIYANSKLMNGNDFAVEFIRRKKLAEEGIVEPANNGSGFSSAKSGGWNEVAKKGPAKVEEPTAGFKVVPNKKKGRK